MARRIVHQLVDDIDGTVLDVGEGETVLFSLDGVTYEIDLTTENARSLRNSLAPFIGSARRVSASRGGSATEGATRSRRRTGQPNYGGIREWAKENGYRVSDRGRVPASVIEAYDAAH